MSSKVLTYSRTPPRSGYRTIGLYGPCPRLPQCSNCYLRVYTVHTPFSEICFQNQIPTPLLLAQQQQHTLHPKTTSSTCTVRRGRHGWQSLPHEVARKRQGLLHFCLSLFGRLQAVRRYLHLGGQKQRDRRPLRRLARAPEAVAGRPVARPTPLSPWEC